MPAGLFDTAGQEPLDHADGQDAEGRYRAVAGTAIAAAVAAALSPLAFFDWSLVVVPILGVVLRKTGKSIRRGSKGALEASEVLLRNTNEALQGLRAVKTAGAERVTVASCLVWNTPASKPVARAGSSMSLANPVVAVVENNN